MSILSFKKVESLNKIKSYIQAIDKEKIKNYYTQSKEIILVSGLVFVSLFVFVSKQMHKLLKQSIIACRYIADQLERADQGLEYLKQENLSFFAPAKDNAALDVATVLHEKVNDLTTQYTNSELRKLTGIKSKISKQKLAETYCSLLI